jgi:hypothetical protein
VTQKAQARITRDEPVSYQIQVQGHLSQTWADYLGNLAVSVSGDGQAAVTTLSGQVTDQAALMGLLNSLYDLGFSLLSVEYQPNPRKEVVPD